MFDPKNPKPGIYYDLPFDVYHAAPGISNSGMKHLAVSPLQFWHQTLNPAKEKQEESEYLRFGHALHCAVLEPGVFLSRYACELNPADFPGLLTKADDLKDWLKQNGIDPKGTTKAGWTKQIHDQCRDVPVWDVLEAEHLQRCEGKTLVPVDEWARVTNLACALNEEESLKPVLATGKPEVSVFAIDPETGVLLKCRTDWWGPEETLDLKTFTNKRGKSVDQTVSDALWYEGYLDQAWHYSYVRELATGEPAGFVFAFGESDAPHDIRIKRMVPERGGYWTHSMLHVKGLYRLYAEYAARYGNTPGCRPWRDPQRIEDLTDEDVRQLAWS